MPVLQGMTGLVQGSVMLAEGMSQVKRIAAVPQVKVSADGHGVMSHAFGTLNDAAGGTACPRPFQAKGQPEPAARRECGPSQVGGYHDRRTSTAPLSPAMSAPRPHTGRDFLRCTGGHSRSSRMTARSSWLGRGVTPATARHQAMKRGPTCPGLRRRVFGTHDRGSS